MHALECLAIRHGVATKQTPTPVMYQAFVDSIKSNGRIHELSFTLRYYLRTIRFYLPTKTNPLNPLKAFGLLGMIPVALGLFLHGRMPLRPSKIKGGKELKAIIEKAQAIGGAP
jgi:hypothetical protein